MSPRYSNTVAPKFHRNKLLWCFDEAPCDLYELAPRPELGSFNALTLLEDLVEAVANLHFMGSIWVPHLSHISLLSGTALNIKKKKKKKKRELFFEDYHNIGGAYD